MVSLHGDNLIRPRLLVMTYEPQGPWYHGLWARRLPIRKAMTITCGLIDVLLIAAFGDIIVIVGVSKMCEK